MRIKEESETPNRRSEAPPVHQMTVKDGFNAAVGGWVFHAGDAECTLPQMMGIAILVPPRSHRIAPPPWERTRAYLLETVFSHPTNNQWSA